MAPSQDHQVEKLVDEALKHSRFLDLDHFLFQNESKTENAFKCSRQFITKLNKLFIREIDLGDVEHACLVLTILHKYGDRLIFPGVGGIPALVSQGFVKKWFEKARKLWVEAGPSRNESLLKLAEDFFDALMIVHASCKEGTYEVTEALLHRIGKLVSDAQINIMIQKEAARKLNAIMAKIPMELKRNKKILSVQEASFIMNNLAVQILKGGDYDLQVSLMEALFRMTSQSQRNELAESWFSMTFVSSAFKKIKDSKFETDCRKFLNMVNGMQGEGRSVCSYPCLGAFLDKHELLMPEDENLEAFWIDFNIGSQSISFYYCVTENDAQDGRWDTLCITENEVHGYTIEEESGRKMLQLVLTEAICLDTLEGSRVVIIFSSSLDILRATEDVYGLAKHRTSVMKTSVVKTPVHISLSSQESSQVFVPESQVVPPSLHAEGRGSSLKRHDTPCPPVTGTTKVHEEMVTPVRIKVSESCTYISGSVGRQQGSSASSCVLPSVSKLMVKPALQMMSSLERKKESALRELMMSKTSCNLTTFHFHYDNNQNKSTLAAQNKDQQKIQSEKAKATKYSKRIPVDEVVEMLQTGKEHEEDNFNNCIVPDSQPVRNPKSFSPSDWSLNSSNRKSSVSGLHLARQKDCPKKYSVPDDVAHPPTQCQSPAQCASKTLTQNQLHNQLTKRLDEVLRKQQRADDHAAQNAPLQRGSSLASQKKGNVDKSMPARPSRQRRQSNNESMAHSTESMVKKMSSRKRNAKVTSPDLHLASENRYSFSKSLCPSTTEKSTTKSSSSHNKSKIAFQKMEDVYAFTEDTPNIGVRKKSSGASRIKSSELSSSSTLCKSAGRPRQLPKASKSNAKKHLFSDTDTENITELSWLNSANRKPKAKLADYSRKPAIPKADSSLKWPNTPLSSPKPVKEQIKPIQKRQNKVIQVVDKRWSSIHDKKASGRPQRAAALTKTYRELSDSDDRSSLSESEKAPPLKKRAVGKPAKLQETRAAGQRESQEKTPQDVARHQSENNIQKKTDKGFAKIQQDLMYDKSRKMSSPEHLKVKISSAQGSARTPKESWTARLSRTFAGGTSPIEKMRSDKKLNNTRAITTPLRSLSISPIEADSPQRPLGPLKEIRVSSLCKTPGNNGTVKPLQSTSVSRTSRGSKRNAHTAQQAVLSPVHSLLTLTQPLTIEEDCTQSSPLISPELQEQPRAMKKTSLAELEKTPACQQGRDLERPEFKSGPTVIHQHVVPCHSADLSERDEDSDEDKENKAPSPSQLALKMRPRMLFAPSYKYQTPSPNIKILVKDQSSSEEEEEYMFTENMRRKKRYKRGFNKRAKDTTISTEEVEMLSSCTNSSCKYASVEASVDLTMPTQEVGFICHQFGSEIKRKIKNRCRTMDLYTRQSLKTIQQHMSSISVQVHKQSSQRLEKVKQVLLGEIEILEQDDSALRKMEEDLKTYWEKQTLAFHTYHKKGTKRLQLLKSTLQDDVCDCLEFEGKIFSVEMTSMKKNMKSVQDRFFKEMQDAELTSVRAGLQSLFFRDASRL